MQINLSIDTEPQLQEAASRRMLVVRLFYIGKFNDEQCSKT